MVLLLLLIFIYTLYKNKFYPYLNNVQFYQAHWPRVHSSLSRANGEVFLVQNTQDNSIHVIKRLKVRDISEKESETIETELSLLKKFKHVNIVPFRDSFIGPEGDLNIVMGYCEGGDMHNLIEEAEGKKFEEKRIIEWIIQLALSILYLHERRILHRDIKTQNIFLTNGRIMLGDFGVSKVLEETVDLAKTNIGTPYYMSPEQYRSKPYNYKSDIWAFGCIIYEMCNHKHAFEALSINALAVKVMKGIYAPVSQEYSQELRNLVGDMLSQNAKTRPSIIEILMRPFLFGKVQNYMKKIYNEKDKYEAEIIQSLVDQAKTLGFSLVQQIPKKVEKNETPSKKTKAEIKQSEKTSREASKEKLKIEREKKYEELQEKLRKEIEERNRAQDKLKEMVKKNNQKKVEEKKKIADKYSLQKIKPKREDNSTQQSSRSKLNTDDLSNFSEEKSKREEYEEKEGRKNFKIAEDYDMDYEEYSDKENPDDHIFEEDEEDDTEEVEKVRISAQSQKKAEIKQQPKPEAPKVEAKIVEKNVEDEAVKVVKLEKEVKDKTINITNIRNEMSKLDFSISSDSESGERIEKTNNPAYTRISDKINDLKQKIIAQLGRVGYKNFLEFFEANNNKPDKAKIIEVVGKDNIGVWQFAENIFKLERVVSNIPKYLN